MFSVCIKNLKRLKKIILHREMLTFCLKDLSLKLFILRKVKIKILNTTGNGKCNIKYK